MDLTHPEDDEQLRELSETETVSVEGIKERTKESVFASSFFLPLTSNSLKSDETKKENGKSSIRKSNDNNARLKVDQSFYLSVFSLSFPGTQLLLDTQANVRSGNSYPSPLPPFKNELDGSSSRKRGSKWETPYHDGSRRVKIQTYL